MRQNAIGSRPLPNPERGRRMPKGPGKQGVSQVANKLGPEGGGGFNPRIMLAESTRALAPEGNSQSISHEIPSFSAACSAPEEIWPYSRNLFRGSFKRVLQRIDHHAKAIHSARRAGQGIHHRKTVDRAGKTHGGYLDPGITELLGIGLALIP